MQRTDALSIVRKEIIVKYYKILSLFPLPSIVRHNQLKLYDSSCTNKTYLVQEIDNHGRERPPKDWR